MKVYLRVQRTAISHVHQLENKNGNIEALKKI